MHPANLPTPPEGEDIYALVGLLVFVVFVIGMCVYLVWKLPRDDDGGN